MGGGRGKLKSPPANLMSSGEEELLFRADSGEIDEEDIHRLTLQSIGGSLPSSTRNKNKQIYFTNDESKGGGGGGVGVGGNGSKKPHPLHTVV